MEQTERVLFISVTNPPRQQHPPQARFQGRQRSARGGIQSARVMIHHCVVHVTLFNQGRHSRSARPDCAPSCSRRGARMARAPHPRAHGPVVRFSASPDWMPRVAFERYAANVAESVVEDDAPNSRSAQRGSALANYAAFSVGVAEEQHWRGNYRVPFERVTCGFLSVTLLLRRFRT